MMNRQQLGNVLWGMVDTVLRDKVEDYKPYVLSLLFFKRLSDNYKWEINHRSKQFEKEHDGPIYQNNLASLGGFPKERINPLFFTDKTSLG
jgi:type I restriction-modification system DNA methylase subunit